MFYDLDNFIGTTPCKYCQGTSDRWFAEGFCCRDCFDKLHSFKGTLEEKELQCINALSVKKTSLKR